MNNKFIERVRIECIAEGKISFLSGLEAISTLQLKCQLFVNHELLQKTCIKFYKNFLLGNFFVFNGVLKQHKGKIKLKL
jgi:hypothetical protein